MLSSLSRTFGVIVICLKSKFDCISIVHVHALLCLYEIFGFQEWATANGGSSFIDILTNAIDEVEISLI